jgi:hypothetical protein
MYTTKEARERRAHRGLHPQSVDRYRKSVGPQRQRAYLVGGRHFPVTQRRKVEMMALQTDSSAVDIACRHIQAYTNGDLETARGNVADDVQADTNGVRLNGIDEYMAGLTRFAGILERGSLRVLAARGDENFAIIMTEHTAFGDALPSARTFKLDEKGKIKEERVVFQGEAV